MNNFRSLADDLRHRQRSDWEFLLHQRRDLIHPEPSSISDLAARAATTDSIALAVRDLPMNHLAVITAICQRKGDWTCAEIAAELDADEHDIDRMCHDLWKVALLWNPTHYRLARNLPVAVEAMGLLQRDDITYVARRPIMDSARMAVEDVDRGAGGIGLQLVHTLSSMLDVLEDIPLTTTVDNTVTFRSVERLSTDFGWPLPRTAMWLELAWLSGLIGVESATGTVLPTWEGRKWLEKPPAESWPVIVQTWWNTQRDWSRCITADCPVFGNTHLFTRMDGLRRRYLALLAAADEGVAPADIPTLLHASAPLLNTVEVLSHLASLQHQAEELGVTYRGALSSLGRALVSIDPDTVDPHLPVAADLLTRAAEAIVLEPISDIVVQADATIVAPGPLEPVLSQRLAAFAHIESRGGATVYRLTSQSLQRAFERGWSAADIHDVLSAASITEIPQPVTYLITDIERRAGSIHVLESASVIHVQESSEVPLVQARLDAEGLHYRLVEDCVFVLHTPAPEVLAHLVDAGIPATASTGQSHAMPLVAPVPELPLPAVPLAAVTVDVLDRLLATPEAQAEHTTHQREVPRLHPAQVHAVLQQALDNGSDVWLKYADNIGTAHVYCVQPIGLDNGVLRAREVAVDQQQISAGARSFAVSRIVGVQNVRESA